MTRQTIDLATWPRADQFRHFRSYQRPHYATTARIDVTRLMDAKARGQSVYRASVHAIGAGIHAVPELCMRFRGNVVTRFDRVELSMTVPLADGNFRYAYVPWHPDRATFDAGMAAVVARAAAGGELNANPGQQDVAYLSCLPWLDYSAINNAMADADDCIPRVSWGKIVTDAGCSTMAMTLEVHHALVDGRQVGDFFAAVQSAADA
jgi:chloramphenicol O-acetyltransferase type A